MFTGDDVVKAALSYKDVRFKKWGRDKNGVDCVGLLAAVARDLGVEIDDMDHYPYKGDIMIVRKMVYAQTIELPRRPINGSIVALRQAAVPMHFGFIRVNNGQVSVINANMEKRKVVEDSFDLWKDLVMKVRAFKGMQI